MPKIYSLLNDRIEPRTLEVEISTHLQIPLLHIIGLPGPEVSEASDRIRAAFDASELPLPNKKIILNLSPASIRKQGTGLDLAMAIRILAAEFADEDTPWLCWGELALDGAVKPASQIVRVLAAARERRIPRLFLSAEDARKAAILRRELFPRDAIEIHGIGHLREAPAVLRGETAPAEFAPPPEDEVAARRSGRHLLPLPESIERLVVVALSGRHHVLLLGPKGIGKTHAFDWIEALSPALSNAERIDQRTLAELGEQAGVPEEPMANGLYRYVSPHVRAPALVGSFAQQSIVPGEFALAHGGILFADEFPEWSRDARESLRQPLETGKVVLSRTHRRAEFPARFLFAGNGNLCPCGGSFEAPEDRRMKPCVCRPQEREAYLKRLSGPILDRIDLVRVLRMEPPRSIDAPVSEHCEHLRAAIERARDGLRATWGKLPGEMSGADLENAVARELPLREELEKVEFRSFRDRHKVLRIALTLAALAGLRLPARRHWKEAEALRGQEELEAGLASGGGRRRSSDHTYAHPRPGVPVRIP